MTTSRNAFDRRKLVDVATGRAHADLVIRSGRWVNVHSGEIIEDVDIAIVGERIAYVGPNARHAIGERTRVMEAKDRYLVPGLCDAHMHVESGMLTVTEFTRAVLPHGTTSMFVDPHEIANVLGIDGVRLMHDEALGLPINILVQAPSCIPSAPGLETAGAAFGPDEINEALTWPGIIGLGEVMNFPGVIANDAKMATEIDMTLRAGKIIGGHYASPDLGLPFHGYVAGGAEDDHEGTRAVDAVARVRQGMRAMLRLGSAWYDVAEQVKAITENKIESRYLCLCTDDCHAATLVGEGHMDRVVRHAIAQGLNPITAIQMATLNTAEHFGLARDIGSITPGRFADIVITSDLSAFPVELVIAHGKIAAEQGELLLALPAFSYPAAARDTIRLKRAMVEADFDIRAPAGRNAVDARVIGVIENQAPTRALIRQLQVEDGIVQMDHQDDVCQVALVERHRGSGTVINGFVSGFGYRRPCAMASTVAHDCHQLIVVGTSKSDMARAANRLAEIGGGIALYMEGQEAALIELPIAGLMSDQPAEHVATKIRQLITAMTDAGCVMNNAYMQHSLLALAVIPELRITDKGLVDVSAFRHTSVLIEQGG